MSEGGLYKVMEAVILGQAFTWEMGLGVFERCVLSMRWCIVLGEYGAVLRGVLGEVLRGVFRGACVSLLIVAATTVDEWNALCLAPAASEGVGRATADLYSRSGREGFTSSRVARGLPGLSSMRKGAFE